MSNTSSTYGVKFTQNEWSAIEKAADKAGLSKHAFIRIAALVLAGASELPRQISRICAGKR